jgi:hypothetical protein
MESYANDLFSDRDKVFPDAPPLLIDKIWEMSERRGPLDKLDLILDLKQKSAFDKETDLYKAMLAATRLRNELTHFKPEWSQQADKHLKISEVLKGHFIPASSRFPNEPIFPRAWVSHSCTGWAVNTTLSFIEGFEKLAGLTGRTDRSKFGDRLTP